MRFFTYTGSQLLVGVVLGGAVLLGVAEVVSDNEREDVFAPTMPGVHQTISHQHATVVDDDYADVGNAAPHMPYSSLAPASSVSMATSSSASNSVNSNVTQVAIPHHSWHASSSSSSSSMGSGHGSSNNYSSHSDYAHSSMPMTNTSWINYASRSASAPRVATTLQLLNNEVVSSVLPSDGGLMGTGGGLQPPVYEGDEPGIIFGNENSLMDNPIITSYGTPVGDALIPLLILAFMYLGCKELVRKPTNA